MDPRWRGEHVRKSRFFAEAVFKPRSVLYLWVWDAVSPLPLRLVVLDTGQIQRRT